MDGRNYEAFARRAGRRAKRALPRGFPSRQIRPRTGNMPTMSHIICRENFQLMKIKQMRSE
jgi:hypothetical protein